MPNDSRSLQASCPRPASLHNHHLPQVTADTRRLIKLPELWSTSLTLSGYLASLLLWPRLAACAPDFSRATDFSNLRAPQTLPPRHDLPALQSTSFPSFHPQIQHAPSQTSPRNLTPTKLFTLALPAANPPYSLKAKAYNSPGRDRAPRAESSRSPKSGSALGFLAAYRTPNDQTFSFPTKGFFQRNHNTLPAMSPPKGSNG